MKKIILLICSFLLLNNVYCAQVKEDVIESYIKNCKNIQELQLISRALINNPVGKNAILILESNNPNALKMIKIIKESKYDYLSIIKKRSKN